MDRRLFLFSAMAAAIMGPHANATAWTPGAPLKIDPARFSSRNKGKVSKPLKILFLGGTNFLGPPTVQHLLDRGHEVTLFNRGQTNPYLFPQLEKLRGNRYPDRDDGLLSLQGSRQWDVVIDTWRENPLAVQRTLDLLDGRFGRYIYTSSIAVYGNQNYETLSEITEETPVQSAKWPETIEEETGYRRSKILADQAVLGLGPRGTSIRCHGIYGYYMGPDTDGQTYWPIRVDKGGDILAPGDGLDTVQYVDVQDVAAFIATIAEKERAGAYNLGARLTFREFLNGLQSIAQHPSTIHWVPQPSLLEAGISPYSNMPLWVPRSMGPAFFNIADAKAVSAGLTYAPFEDTFRQVIDGFYAAHGTGYQFDENIISKEKAQEILISQGFIEP